ERIVEESGCVELKGLLAQCIVAPAATVARAVSILKRLKTDSHICAVLRVNSVGDAAQQCLITDSHVTVALRVIEERRSAIGRVRRAGGIVVPPSGVAVERINASAGVVAAAGIAEQGPKTRRRIGLAGSILIERLETKAAVPDACAQIDQGPAAIGRISLRLRLLRKRKAD